MTHLTSIRVNTLCRCLALACAAGGLRFRERWRSGRGFRPAKPGTARPDSFIAPTVQIDGRDCCDRCTRRGGNGHRANSGRPSRAQDNMAR